MLCVIFSVCVYLKGRLADVAPADYFRVNPCLFCLAFLWLSLNWRERLCRWMGWVWIPYINQMEKTDIQSCTPRHQPPSKACLISRTSCGAQAAKCIISLKSLQSDQSAQKYFLFIMLDCKYPTGIAFPMWCFDSDQILVFITQKMN